MGTTTVVSKRPTRSWAAPEVRRRSAIAICFALFCLSSAGCVRDGDLQLVSGQYEQLMLAVDAQGKVTGYFREEQGDVPAKSCVFFLLGTARAHAAIPVSTWNEDVFAGTLKAERHGVQLTIEHGREHPGCGLVLLPQIARGLELDRVADAKWSELRRVIQPRVHFHTSPDPSSAQPAFVVSGDVVGVLERQGEWLRVEYRGKQGMTRGWVRTKHTTELRPPGG